MRPAIQNQYGNDMEEIVLFWPWGGIKSITYLKDGEAVDRLVYDEDGNYKDFESISPIA